MQVTFSISCELFPIFASALPYPYLHSCTAFVQLQDGTVEKVPSAHHVTMQISHWKEKSCVVSGLHVCYIEYIRDHLRAGHWRYYLAQLVSFQCQFLPLFSHLFRPGKHIHLLRLFMMYGMACLIYLNRRFRNSLTLVLTQWLGWEHYDTDNVRLVALSTSGTLLNLLPSELSYSKAAVSCQLYWSISLHMGLLLIV